MGEIYERAGSVRVLLPEADQKLFENLCVMRESALQKDSMGLMDFDNITWDTLNASHENVIEIFLSSFEGHKRSLDGGNYFQHTWTFQEWALARDVDVTCESVRPDNHTMTFLSEVKTCVIRAAVRLAIHQKSLGPVAVKCKIGDADLPDFVDDIRALGIISYELCGPKHMKNRLRPKNAV
jgi:hypothetical protein